MPIDSSIPLQAHSPSAGETLQNLSSMLGLRQQQLALKGQAAQVQQEQQTAKQRSALADFDVSKVIGEDGTIDLNKIPGSGLREAAGDAFPDVLAKYMGVKQQQLAAKTQLVQLKDTQRNSFGQMIGALRSDDDVTHDTPQGRQKVVQALGQYGQMYGPDVQNVLQAYAAPIAQAPPGKLSQVLQNIQLQAVDAGTQAEKQRPNYGFVDTGARDIRTQNNALAPGGANMPTEVQHEVGPSADVLQDPRSGNFYRFNRQNNTVTPVGAGGGSQAAPNAPPVMNPGEAATIHADVGKGAEMAWANRNAAAVAKVNRDALSKIEDLADKAQTGPGSQEFAALKSAVGGFTGIKGASNSATNVNELTKLLAQVGVQRAVALGMGGSDARLGEIEKSLPSAKADPEALKYAAQYNRAIEHAAEAKGDAQSKWYEEHGQNYATHGQFEDKWRQSADPHVFQALEMPDEQAAKFYKGLSATDKSKFKASYEKLKALGAVQ
jgi:hypothetical protein